MATAVARRPKPEVVESSRAYDAHQLRLAGVGWQQVAEQVGYADGRVASVAVTAWLQRCAVEAGPAYRRQALDLELARLDQLQAAFWQLALAGDVHSAAVVLKIVDKRTSLLGLERLDDALDRGRTIVVGGTSEQYIAALRDATAIAESGAAR